MKRVAVAAVVLLTAAVAGSAAASPPQGTQSDSAFAQSYAVKMVTNVLATTQRVSCYAPEVTYFGTLTAAQGYPNGGMTPCPRATTGEQTQGFATQDVANQPMVVKDHSESDIRVDPLNPNHLIGSSKWIVSAEGYNHLLGFYESWDGGKTWPTQGHIPGYEGWTDNTDPVGAFDPWGNYYSLVLPYQFVYSNSGGHVYNNGSNQANPALPPEAISIAVHPAGATKATQWITTHNGGPDYVWTSKNANTGDPDKQWITIDDNPASPFYGRAYAMFVDYILNPSIPLVSYAQTHRDGTHTDWSPVQELPSINGNRFDQYLLPHVAPDGTVYTPITHNPQQQQYANNDFYLDSSTDGGVTWNGPQPIRSGVVTPTYANTTFREGIIDSFAVGNARVNGHYPLYLTYENQDADGFSRVYLLGSFDGGATWSFTAIQVNDDTGASDAIQPNLSVAPNGTVGVAFYDRRLACPAKGTAEARAAGIQYDPKQPYGMANYCINSAVQFYSPTLQPVGHNVRLSAHTWDPQLSAPHPGSIGGSTTFIGDYFGIDSGGGWTYTSSVSTYNDGSNPSNYQQQAVARVATP